MRLRTTRLTAIASGIRRASAPPVFLPILDSLTAQPPMACSFRKLRTAYAGACVRVRRSSDNTETDIGFTASGVLNETALLAHVGAGDGFVSTWYAQDGGVNHLIQPNSLYQPKIVTAGVVEKLATSGLPAINFESSRSTHLYTAASFLEHRFSFASAFAEGAPTGAASQIFNRTNGLLGSVYLTLSSRLACRLGDAAAVITSPATIPAFTASVATGYASNEKRSMLLNGQANLVNTQLQTVAAGGRQIYVGVIPPTSSPFNGRMAELIVTNNVDITTNGDQSILHGNMMTTWGAV